MKRLLNKLLAPRRAGNVNELQKYYFDNSLAQGKRRDQLEKSNAAAVYALAAAIIYGLYFLTKLFMTL